MRIVPPRPTPGPDVVKRALAALRDKARRPARPHDLDARDPEFIARIAPVMDILYDRYFRCETEVEGELPSGAFLAVANHNGMTGTPDMFCHMAAFWRLCSPARAAYGLMHDMPFRVPGAGPWLNACGAISASPENARRALRRGAAVLVFPGGDIDACKPYRRRYAIEFGARRGFVRLAIQQGAPIVPVVSAGAHQSLYILTDGRDIARFLHLPDLARSNVAPFGLALPWGLIAGIPLPHLPLPVKIHTRILQPIHLDLAASAADDPVAVERAFDHVVGMMQGEMDNLRREGRHGLFPRG